MSIDDEEINPTEEEIRDEIIKLRTLINYTQDPVSWAAYAMQTALEWSIRDTRDSPIWSLTESARTHAEVMAEDAADPRPIRKVTA